MQIGQNSATSPTFWGGPPPAPLLARSFAGPGLAGPGLAGPISGPSALSLSAAFAAPRPAPAPVPVAGERPPAAARDTDTLRAHALLAKDVYAPSASPPPGYRVAGEAELRALNLDPSLLQAGDFHARVYAEGSGADARYVIAMRGTRFESLADWTSNAQQAFGADSAHYRAALLIGERVGRSDLAGQVSFTGHSLGGGLASAAAVASGRPADTFNAAGLHDATIARGEAIRTANGIETRASVQTWNVEGEILSSIQDGGDRVLGGVLGAIVTRTPAGTAAGAALLDLPEAYGTRHAMDAVAPEGTNWFDRNLNPMLPVNRHGMDWVLASLPR